MLKTTRAILGVMLMTLTAVGALVIGLSARQSNAPYSVVTTDGRKALPIRTMNNVEMVALDQLASLFSLALREDTLAGAMNITTSRQAIVLTSGQAAASVGGRVLSLSSNVVRDGRSWYVPLDFLARVLAPATGLRIETRAGSRTVLVGDIKWPIVAVRLERQGAGVRVSADVQPATPFHLSREGNRVTARFEATAVDLTLGGAVGADLVTAVHADGVTVTIDLGPAASIVRPADDGANTRFTVDVAPAPRDVQEAPPVELGSAGLTLVAIDAGHGGEEPGAKSGSGAAEKDLTLALARRLRTAIESKLGLRVVMTRDGDDTLPLDRRTALVNNSQSDVLISLHADASFRPATSGAQILTLSAADYQRRLPPATAPAVTVPLAGGGTRTLDVVPWDLAQLPHIAASTAFAASAEGHLRERQVPMHARAQESLPLRLLAGANMPAILVEAGFLSNAGDAAALAGNDRATAIVDALIAALTDLRASMARGGGQ